MRGAAQDAAVRGHLVLSGAGVYVVRLGVVVVMVGDEHLRLLMRAGVRHGVRSKA